MTPQEAKNLLWSFQVKNVEISWHTYQYANEYGTNCKRPEEWLVQIEAQRFGAGETLEQAVENALRKLDKNDGLEVPS